MPGSPGRVLTAGRRRTWPAGLRPGQGPGSAGVGQAAPEQGAQINRGAPGVQPGVVLGGADVAELDAAAVAGRGPGDGPSIADRVEQARLNCGVRAWARAARSRFSCGWKVMDQPSLAVVHRWRSGQPAQAERDGARQARERRDLQDGPHPPAASRRTARTRPPPGPRWSPCGGRQRAAPLVCPLQHGRRGGVDDDERGQRRPATARRGRRAVAEMQRAPQPHAARPRSRRGGPVRRARRGHSALSPVGHPGVARKLRCAVCGCAAAGRPDGGRAAPGRGLVVSVISAVPASVRPAGARRRASRLGYWLAGGGGLPPRASAPGRPMWPRQPPACRIPTARAPLHCLAGSVPV